MAYKQITFFLISLFFYVITSKKFIILTFNQFLLLILLKNIGYDEQGQRNVIVYGNKTKTVYKYNKKRGWLSNIETVNFETGNQYQNIFYNFDAVGNVSSYTNNCLKTGNYSTDQKYTYDALYQLIYVEGTTKYYTTAGLNVPSMEDNYIQTFEFDNIGNMMSKVSKETSRGSHKTNEALNYNLDYTYAQNYAHRVERAGDMNFVYDESGNLILEYEGQPLENPDEDNVVIVVEKDVYATEGAWGYGSNGNGGSQEVPKGHKRYYEWNDRNQLTRTLDSTYDTSYVYNNDGQRVAKYTSSLTATSETLYFNNFWTWHTDTANQFDGGQYSKNIYLGEIRIVTKLVSGKNNYMEVEGKNIYYYHTDHLGSASLVTNYEGKEYERMEYTPYGEVWVDIKQNTGTIYLPYKFSAKEMDSETGLYYYGARYLDPKYNMWKSTDPALAEYIPIASTNDEWSKKNSNLPGMGGIFNHTNFHLYHYAGNNPINYIDPDGNYIINNDILGDKTKAFAIKEGKNSLYLNGKYQPTIFSNSFDPRPGFPIYFGKNIGFSQKVEDALIQADIFKNDNNSKTVAHIKAKANFVENGVYEIQITITTNTSVEEIKEVVAYAGENEIMTNGKIDQEKINAIANNSINTVMRWGNDKKNMD